MRLPAAIAGAVLVCSVTASHATDLVVFEDGRGVRVKAIEIGDDGAARLTLEDGGQIGVPTSSIASVERAIDPQDVAPVDVAHPAAETQALASDLSTAERWRKAAGKYAETIAAAADRHALDRALLAAVAKVESNFNPFAISPRGACGILQLMPGTVRRFGVKNVFDATQNIEAGASYLRWLLDRYNGRVDLALAGYNAGEGAVDRHHGIPPFAETEWYILKVLDHQSRTYQSPSR